MVRFLGFDDSMSEINFKKKEQKDISMTFVHKGAPVWHVPAFTDLMADGTILRIWFYRHTCTHYRSTSLSHA